MLYCPLSLKEIQRGLSKMGFHQCMYALDSGYGCITEMSILIDPGLDELLFVLLKPESLDIPDLLEVVR